MLGTFSTFNSLMMPQTDRIPHWVVEDIDTQKVSDSLLIWQVGFLKANEKTAYMLISGLLKYYLHFLKIYFGLVAR